MKIGCHCENTIFDQTDDMPNKAHLIPDQRWNEMWDALEDQVLTAVARGTLSPNDACFEAMRIALGAGMRLMWQCASCGRLYIDDRDGNLQCYVPSSAETNKQILRARDA
jgi:hypothetical protein